MENDELLTAEELSGYYNVDVSLLSSLHERGLIELVIIEQKSYLAKVMLPELEKIIRLHIDLEINLEGIEAIVHLLRRLEVLQQKLSFTTNRLRIYES